MSSVRCVSSSLVGISGVWGGLAVELLSSVLAVERSTQPSTHPEPGLGRAFGRPRRAATIEGLAAAPAAGRGRRERAGGGVAATQPGKWWGPGCSVCRQAAKLAASHTKIQPQKSAPRAPVGFVGKPQSAPQSKPKPSPPKSARPAHPWGS
jgi:hypothetical protein